MANSGGITRAFDGHVGASRDWQFTKWKWAFLLDGLVRQCGVASVDTDRRRFHFWHGHFPAVGHRATLPTSQSGLLGFGNWPIPCGHWKIGNRQRMDGPFYKIVIANWPFLCVKSRIYKIYTRLSIKEGDEMVFLFFGDFELWRDLFTTIFCSLK